MRLHTFACGALTLLAFTGAAVAEPTATRHDFTGLNQKTMRTTLELPNGAGGYVATPVSFYISHSTSSDCPKVFAEDADGSIAVINAQAVLLDPQSSGAVTNQAASCMGSSTYTLRGRGLGYISTSSSRKMRIAFEVPSSAGAPLGGYVFDGYWNPFKNRLAGAYWGPDKKVRPFVAEEVFNYGDSFGMQGRRVRLRAANGLYVSFANSNVAADVSSPGDTETFTLLDTLGNRNDTALRSGDYVVLTRPLDAENREYLWVYRGPLGGGYVGVGWGNNWRNYYTDQALQMTVVSGPNPVTGTVTVTFRSASGNYLSAEGDSPLRVGPTTAGTNERFTLEVIEGPFTFEPDSGTH